MESVEQLVEQEGIRREYQNKLLAVSEVLLVYASIAGLMWITELIPEFEAWQRIYMDRAILSVMLYMALPSVLLFYLHGRKSGAQIFSSDTVKKGFKAGGKSLGIMILVTFAFPIAQGLGFNYMDWGGAVIIASFYLVATATVLWMFRKESTLHENGFSRADGSITGWIFLTGLVLIAGLHQVNAITRDVIIALLFVGFMEEFFFRGYMQPRLNMAFGKPFEVLSLKFGWGIILTSALFGLMHVISPGNPLQWSWGFWTFIAGLGFGVIREKGGSFLAPAVVHGITMIFPIAFS